MGPTVGQAVITIGADASGFQHDLAKQTDKSAKDTGDRYGTVMGGALKAAAVGIGVAAGATIGVGLSTAMNTEVANMKFTQLFKGQTDKAQGFIADLKAFAARTPFDFPGLQESAGRFLAVGIEASRVIPIMTTLGDATSIMGTGAEGINRATTALTQMAQKGKVSGEEILQLTEAGIPALDALAASMGKPVPEVQKLIEKGLVPADAMFEALEKSSGKALSSMSGGMEKMSQTTTGKLSTLKDDFSQLAGSIVEKALPAINWLVDAGENLVKFFSENDAAAKALQVTIGVVAAAITAHYVKMGVEAGIAAARSVAAWALMSAQAMIHAVRMAAAWLIAMGPIGLIIAAVVGLVAIIIANLDTIKSWISSAWDWITDITYKAWNGIWSFFEDLWESITSTITDSVDNVKSWLSTAWDWIRDTAAAAWDKIKWVIAGPIVALVALIINNWDTIKGALAAAWAWIQDTAEAVWYGIQRFFFERWNTIKQIFTDAVDNVKRFLTEGWEAMRRVTSEAWDRIKTAVSERINAVVTFARELPGKIVSAVGDLARTLYDKGTQVIQGLLDGAIEKLKGIGAWASSIKDKIVDAIKGVFGINSPSTVMASLGQFMMQGLMNGLLQGPALLHNVVKGIGGNLMDWLGGLGSRVSEFFGGLFGGGTIQAGRVSFGGKMLDTDTAARLAAALGSGFRLNQGSWSNSVAASMGTHAGAGVADITPTGFGWGEAVRRLNAAGLRAIFRNWPGNQHIHLINPNVAGVSPQAARQLQGEFSIARMFGAYAAGTNSAMPGWGLVGERGPEWVRFRGGETVLPNGTTPGGGGINVVMNVSVDDLGKLSTLGEFVSMLERSRVDARRAPRAAAMAGRY